MMYFNKKKLTIYTVCMYIYIYYTHSQWKYLGQHNKNEITCSSVLDMLKVWSDWLNCEECSVLEKFNLSIKIEFSERLIFLYKSFYTCVRIYICYKNF